MTEMGWIENTRQSYDTVAENYTAFTGSVVGELPVSESFLGLFARLVQPEGRVLDAGCGPGWVTAQLRDLGLDVRGVDLSPRLIEIARTNHPDIPFEVGSITDLPAPARSLAGIVCWWVLHHIPDPVLPTVLKQFSDRLQPGGHLLIGGHLGSSTRTKTAGYGGLPMNVHMAMRPLKAVTELVEAHGFVIDVEATLDPASDAPSLIVLAHTPV